ncbi:MAG: hypothetical protein R2713_00085 [Ilumatobacteraceae bacterium]
MVPPPLPTSAASSSTGGGDAPGLNAVIRAASLAAARSVAGRSSGSATGFNGLLTRRNTPMVA